MHLSRSHHPPAFTMMEMIIFMTMSVIIMGITVSAVGGARNRAQLKEGVNIVVDAIQTARFKAMSNLEVGGCTVSKFEIEATSVSTSPQQISIVPNFIDQSCSSATLQTFNLPSQVQVRLDPAVYPNNEWPIQFAYETPGGDPAIVLLSTSSSVSSFDLIVSLRNGSLSQAITVSTLTGIPEL